MEKNKYIWIASAILFVGGYFIYKEYKKPKPLSITESIDIIVNKGMHENRDFISTFEQPFLSAWASAILENKAVFSYNNKSYNTQGGTSLK